jgi:chitinase
LVRSAHGAKTKVLLSIGGWTGSEKFSPMVASPELRKHFIDWNLDFIEKYNTDGVDIGKSPFVMIVSFNLTTFF